MECFGHYIPYCLFDNCCKYTRLVYYCGDGWGYKTLQQKWRKLQHIWSYEPWINQINGFRSLLCTLCSICDPTNEPLTDTYVADLFVALAAVPTEASPAQFVQVLITPGVFPQLLTCVVHLLRALVPRSSSSTGWWLLSLLSLSTENKAKHSNHTSGTRVHPNLGFHVGGLNSGDQVF